MPCGEGQLGCGTGRRSDNPYHTRMNRELAGPRDGLSRRSVTKGAAWVTPVLVIGAPAPATAASPNCLPQKLAWTALSPGAAVTSGQAFPIGKTTVTYSDTGATTTARNSTVSTSDVGGITAGAGLAFTSPNNTTSTAQTISFSFSAQVTNVSLSIADIDWDGTGYQDRITVNTDGYTSTLGTQITGTGTAASPFRAAQSVSGGVPNTSTAGTITLSWAGPLKQISFTYDQGARVTGSAFIIMSGINFTPTVC